MYFAELKIAVLPVITCLKEQMIVMVLVTGWLLCEHIYHTAI